MSLAFRDYTSWTELGDPIDYIEIRNGEAYSFPISVFNSAEIPNAIDLSTWGFTVTSEIFTMNTRPSEHGSCGCILASSIHNFNPQMGPITHPELEFKIVDALTGTALLTVPSGITPNPSELVTLDDDNTLLNLLTITANYPSVDGSFTNTSKLLVGLVVRYG